MTKFFLKFSGLAFVLALLIATGCNEDDPIIENPLGPEIALSGGDLELLEGESFTVTVTVTPGDNPLNSLRLLVAGSAVPGANISDYVTKVTSNSEDITPQNPLAVDASRENGASYTYEMVPFGQLEGETVTYTFEVTDKALETASVSFDITIVAPPGTPIDEEITGALLNQAGPAGTGGLDLDTGNGTGSNAAEAEIQDEGIDLSLSVANNWRRQISAVEANGVSVRTPDLSKLPEDFSFENITLKEQIQEAYNTGLALTGSDADCNCTDGVSGEEVSEPVQVDDMFVVKKGDMYYIIVVTAVNVTDGDNNDSYEFNIKY
ncbi:MAG: hypothetical protein J5I94_19910 [Phaeodactylibacter sp.]|nr:hypothetical protein [Phaeodactylibacter sp.]